MYALGLNGTFPCVDFMDVTMRDIPGFVLDEPREDKVPLWLIVYVMLDTFSSHNMTRMT